jgi:tetratricopeptide (TPR) repeat protein
MCAELVLDHDPEDPRESTIAEALARQALSFDPDNEDASAYLMQILVSQRRFDQALDQAKQSGRAYFGVHLLALLVEAGGEARRYIPRALEAIGPMKTELIEPLMHQAFVLQNTREALAIYDKILSVPLPEDEVSEERENYVRALNNAINAAFITKQLDRAEELSDRAAPLVDENPFITHSAACVYVAVGRIDDALAMVGRALELGYDHIAKMEADDDLAPLRQRPEWTRMFSAWRGKNGSSSGSKKPKRR